jgi:hypothetical protein
LGKDDTNHSPLPAAVVYRTTNSKAAEGVNRDGFAFVPYTLPL